MTITATKVKSGDEILASHHNSLVDDVQLIDKKVTNSRETSIPRVDIEGDVDSIKGKDDKKDVLFKIFQNGKEIKEYATIKWQGDSSLVFDKKSFRIRFFTDETRVEREKIQILPFVPKVSDINLKAYATDWTKGNDVIVAKVGSELTMLNGEQLEPEQRFGPNQEYITGYPITVYVNGNYQGLYSLNTKKGDAVISDDNNPLNACIQASTNGSQTAFKASTATFDPEVDFELISPDKLTTEIEQSFDDIMRLSFSRTEGEFKNKISEKVNLQSFANWIVLIMYFTLNDTITKNIIYQTRDGMKWSAVPYDFDLAWGINWNGTAWSNYDTMTFDVLKDKNRLIKRLIELNVITDHLQKAQNIFRKKFDAPKIIGMYQDLMLEIGSTEYMKEQEKWPATNTMDTYDAVDLFKFIQKRFDFCDKEFSKLFGENSEPDAPTVITVDPDVDAAKVSAK